MYTHLQVYYTLLFVFYYKRLCSLEWLNTVYRKLVIHFSENQKFQYECMWMCVHTYQHSWKNTHPNRPLRTLSSLYPIIHLSFSRKHWLNFWIWFSWQSECPLYREMSGYKRAGVGWAWTSTAPHLYPLHRRHHQLNLCRMGRVSTKVIRTLWTDYWSFIVSFYFIYIIFYIFFLIIYRPVM